MVQQSEDISDNGTRGGWSFSLIFLVLFTLANYFSPHYYLGELFSRVPFITGVLAIVFYCVGQLNNGSSFMQFSMSIYMLIIVFIFSLLATFVMSVNPEHSLEILNDYTKAIVLFLLISNIVNNINKLFVYLVVIAVCSFGIAFKLVHYPTWAHGRAFLEGSALTGDPNGMTALFIYSLPIVIALFLIKKNTIFRLFLVYITFTLFMGIVEAQSRGGFLALGVSAIVLIHQTKTTKNRLIIFGSSVLLLPVFARYVTPDYIDRIMTIFVSAAEYTGSAAARSSAMEIALDYVKSNAFSEYGLGNHSYLIAETYGVEKSGISMFKGNMLVHSTFLQFGADVGLIPLLFYILFILGLFRALSQAEKKFDESRIRQYKQLIIVVRAMRIALCGFLACAFFLPWAYKFYLYYLGGICLSLKNISNNLRTRS